VETHNEAANGVVWDGTALDGSSLSSGPYIYKMLLIEESQAHSQAGIVFLMR